MNEKHANLKKSSLMNLFSSDLWFLACGIIGFIVISHILVYEVKTKWFFQERYADTRIIGDDCVLSVTRANPDVPLSSVDTSASPLIPSVLPYRRPGSIVKDFKSAQHGDVIRGICNLSTKGFAPQHEIFVHWGTFFGETIFDVGGKVVSSGQFSGRAQAIVTIPRGWSEEILKVGFVTRRNNGILSNTPGPGSLLPIFITQDISQIEKIAASVKSDLLFNRAFGLGTYASILVVLLTMLSLGAKFPDIRWMTLSITSIFLCDFLDFDSQWTSRISVITKGVLYDFSVCALSIALYYYARGKSFRRFPKICFLVFVLLEVLFYGFEIRIGWRYSVAGAFLLLSISGFLLFIDADRNPGMRIKQKKVMGLFVFSAALINTPAEALARYTGIFYSDFIMQILSWSIGGMLAADAVKNLVKSQVLLAGSKHELEKRVLLEKNILSKFSLNALGTFQNNEAFSDLFALDYAKSSESTLNGDWSTRLCFEDGSVLIAFGETEGQGIDSALAAKTVMGIVSGMKRTTLDLLEVIENLDRVFKEIYNQQVTSSGVFIHFMKKGEVKIVNASHPGVLLLKGERGGMEQVPIHRKAIGSGSLEHAGTQGYFEAHLFSGDRITIVNSPFMKGPKTTLEDSLAVIRETSTKDYAKLICKSMKQRDEENEHSVFSLLSKAE